MPKLIVLALFAASLATASCNTISGAGKDVASVGRAMSRTADSARSH